MKNLCIHGILKTPLQVVRAGRFPMGPGSRNQIYSHPTTALHIHGYEGRLHIAKHSFELKPGDVTLTPPHTPSSYDILSPGTHLCIHFIAPKQSTSSGHDLALPLHFRPSEQTAFVADGFARVAGFHRRSATKGNNGKLAATAAATSLQELLLSLALMETKGVTKRHSRSEGALKKLTSLIEERYAEPWTADALSRASGLSQDYIATLYHRHYGISIARALLLRRMEVARHLFETLDLPVKGVGAAVGIPDAQYFNKQFRRINGLSPTAFLLNLSNFG